MSANTSISLTSITGLKVVVNSYGARISSIKIPLNNNEEFEVHEHYEDFEIYKTTRKYSGATVGPYANRIKGGNFLLGCHQYQLDQNEFPNSLHSGSAGLHARNWEVVSQSSFEIVFKTKLNHLEDGLPGNRTFISSYKLIEDDINIEWKVITDQTTVANLTNHAYFNLGRSTHLGSHFFMINANGYLPLNEEKLPTGKISELNEYYNLNNFQRLGTRVFDNNFVLSQPNIDDLSAAAYCPETDITLEVYTDQPGIQFYTGNKKYFCFETQHFPDSPNISSFPSTLIQELKPYQHKCIYRFNY